MYYRGYCINNKMICPFSDSCLRWFSLLYSRIYLLFQVLLLLLQLTYGSCQEWIPCVHIASSLLCPWHSQLCPPIVVGKTNYRRLPRGCLRPVLVSCTIGKRGNCPGSAILSKPTTVSHEYYDVADEIDAIWSTSVPQGRHQLCCQSLYKELYWKSFIGKAFTSLKSCLVLCA